MSRINAALDCGYLDGRVEVDKKIFGRKIARWFVLDNEHRVAQRWLANARVVRRGVGPWWNFATYG